MNCLSSTTATKTGRRCATSTINEIITESNDDQHTLADLFNELKKFKSAHDGKLGAEVKLLKSDRGLKKHKLLIFSEYMATAHYLRNQLEAGAPSNLANALDTLYPSLPEPARTDVGIREILWDGAV